MNSRAAIGLRSPTIQETISLLSASMPGGIYVLMQKYARPPPLKKRVAAAANAE